MNRRARGAWGFGAFLLGTLLALPSPAAADPVASAGAQLSKLRKAGAEAAKARNWEACMDAYSHALELEKDPILFGELGLCEERAGRFSSAHPHLTRALSGMAPGVARRDNYQAALRRVAELVAIVFISVLPTDARVLVDGHPVGIYDGRYVVVPPGPHVFAAGKRGYKYAVKPLTVNAGEMPNVELALTPLPSVDAASAAKPQGAAGPASAGSAGPLAPLRAGGPGGTAPRLPWYMPAWSPRGVLVTLSYAGLAAAATSGATALALEVDRASLSRDRTSCGPDEVSPPARCKSLLDRQLQRDTAVDLLIGAGLASAGLAGAAGIAYGFERGTTSPTIAPTASLNGGGILIFGTW